MIGRLGNVIGWFGNVVALLSLLLFVSDWWLHGDPFGVLVLGLFTIVVFLVCQALRYVLRGVG